MIHVCGARILPAIAYLPHIMDKFYIIHFILTSITGWQIGFNWRVLSF